MPGASTHTRPQNSTPRNESLERADEIRRGEHIVALAGNRRPGELERRSGDAELERRDESNPMRLCLVMLSAGVGHQRVEGMQADAGGKHYQTETHWIRLIPSFKLSI